jgi:DNA-binding CsgD family transcriptional regulator
MSQHENRLDDSQISQPIDDGPARDDSLEILRLAAAHARAKDEAAAAIVRDLNGPLTALLIYIGEIREHSHQFPEAGGNRAYLQQVVENALQQTEHVCALVKQIAGPQSGFEAGFQGGFARSRRAIGFEAPATHGKNAVRATSAMFPSESSQKPLTKREREVLDLISEGYSNKQGALRMGISPRTFESHRAEAMRKLGARNTADLVRKALLHRDAV